MRMTSERKVGAAVLGVVVLMTVIFLCHISAIADTLVTGLVQSSFMIKNPNPPDPYEDERYYSEYVSSGENKQITDFGEAVLTSSGAFGDGVGKVGLYNAPLTGSGIPSIVVACSTSNAMDFAAVGIIKVDYELSKKVPGIPDGCALIFKGHIEASGKSDGPLHDSVASINIQWRVNDVLIKWIANFNSNYYGDRLNYDYDHDIKLDIYDGFWGICGANNELYLEAGAKADGNTRDSGDCTTIAMIDPTIEIDPDFLVNGVPATELYDLKSSLDALPVATPLPSSLLLLSSGLLGLGILRNRLKLR